MVKLIQAHVKHSSKSHSFGPGEPSGSLPRQETQTFFVPTVSASLPWGEKGMVGQHLSLDWYHYSLVSGVQENLHIWVVNVHSIPFNTGKLLFMYPKNIQIIQ